MNDDTAAPLLAIRDLSIRIGERQIVSLDELDIPPGTRLGLIGESGAGKTLTAMSVLGLAPPVASVAGSIMLDGRELVGLDERTFTPIRGTDIGLVLQDPQSALNPVVKVGRQIDEAVRQHTRISRAERKARVLELMEQVRLPQPERLRRQYPHQLSGGQRQRVLIAMAIARRPRLLIADEPASALDATIQAEILDLLIELSETQGMAMLLISHNLGVIRTVCHRVAVIYAGRVVEHGPADTVLDHPRHRYTEALIAANPAQTALEDFTQVLIQPLNPIPGHAPEPDELPSGCPFRDRCAHTLDTCAEVPPVTRAGTVHRFTCWNPASATAANTTVRLA